MLKENLSLGRVLAPVGDNSDTAANNLSGVAVTVKLSKTNPLTELLSIRNLDERDLVLGLVAKGLNKLDVRLLSDRVAEDGKNSLAGRESLGGRSQTTGKTVVGKSNAESTLESILNGDFALANGLNGNFLNFDFFNVRLKDKALIKVFVFCFFFSMIKVSSTYHFDYRYKDMILRVEGLLRQEKCFKR